MLPRLLYLSNGGRFADSVHPRRTTRKFKFRFAKLAISAFPRKIHSLTYTLCAFLKRATQSSVSIWMRPSVYAAAASSPRLIKRFLPLPPSVGTWQTNFRSFFAPCLPMRSIFTLSRTSSLSTPRTSSTPKAAAPPASNLSRSSLTPHRTAFASPNGILPIDGWPCSRDNNPDSLGSHWVLACNL
jgi:hypothetical protein